MKAMTRSWVRSLMMMMIICSTLCCGCGTKAGKPAGEYLNLALAGMEGSDGVTFEGAAALLQGNENTPYVSLYYGGNVKEHNKLTLYTLLPDGSTPETASKAGQIRNLGQTASNAPSYYSQLEKVKGRWQPLGGKSEEDNPLSHLNPIHQLEELKSLEKKVTEERGAGRGMRNLRIELSPNAAHSQLADQLNQEMSALHSRNKGLGESGQSGLDEALEKLWQKRNAELQSRLGQAEVKMVYHLSVDVKRNLPKRLSWTRTITYSGQSTESEGESYVSDVNFYSYR
ncbi:hypothetical protein [Paenibacillus sp. sgz500958]|uniref:hypothetical protein n=1 Tax=Paenibacillus sp. sgz500958 TaxID=3242475 RepID=UPI0036D32F36